MSDDKFDRLLEALPKIAEAVNQFQSADVQERAFEALVRALGLSGPTPVAEATPGFDFVEQGHADENGDAGEVDETETTTTTTRRRRRRSSAATVSAERDIDFRPKDKKAFQDFVAEKKPRNNHERNLVAVYYLEQILGLSTIGAGHVLAAYKDRNWREPRDPTNSLAVTASRERWLDTGNMAAIRTTPGGRNRVEHDMPTKVTNQ